MAALDPVEQLRAPPFDMIAADAVADLLIFHVEIGIDELVAERAHRQARGIGMAPDDLLVLGDGNGGMEKVAAATERLQLIERLVTRLRLIERLAVAIFQRLVAADDQGADGLQHAQRLHLRQRLGDDMGGEAVILQLRLARILVDHSRHGIEGDAGRLQHAAARSAHRCEEKLHSVPSIRSLHNLTIANAVSSIERRVTSITGQPLSAKRRRAKASSAATASAST